VTCVRLPPPRTSDRSPRRRRPGGVFLSALALAAGPGAAVPANATAPGACTGPPSDVRLFVDIDQVNSNRGLVAVTLFADDPRRFLKKLGSLYVGRGPARAPVTHLCLFVPRPGVYALAIYHDANANGKFDRSGLGLPNEGYGFSNNASTFFGPPSFSSVRIAIPRSGLHTRIRMKYL
jgi:uncharacterized protein (DUF2141 family)